MHRTARLIAFVLLAPLALLASVRGANAGNPPTAASETWTVDDIHSMAKIGRAHV